jgi:hypothetical protein
MSELGVRQTTAEVRVLLHGYLRWFTAQIVAAADAVQTNEDDLEIRESAIRLKLGAIPSMQAAVFQREPLAALTDAWALTMALDSFVSAGNGKELFGASQPTVVETMGKLEAEIRTIVQNVVGRQKTEEVQPVLERWVLENPIRDLSLGMRAAGLRASATASAALGTGGLQAVASIDETARDLSDRLTLYAEQLPHEARWQGELLLVEAQHELLSRPFENVDAVTRDIALIETDIDRLTGFALATPELVASERSLLLAALENERRAVLDSVDRQRIDTLAVLQGEREAILAALEEFRRASFDSIESETDRSLGRIDAFRTDTLDRIGGATQAAIDRLFWRALQLVLVLLVGGAALLLLSRLVPRSHSDDQARVSERGTRI